MTAPRYQKLEQEEIERVLKTLEDEVQNLSVSLEFASDNNHRTGEWIIRARKTLEDIKKILHSTHN